MSMGIGKAAEMFAHYIELALRNGGVKLTPDMQRELSDATQAFKDADTSIDAAMARKQTG